VRARNVEWCVEWCEEWCEDANTKAVHQRCYRGHLGRRRYTAQVIFRWELHLHVAAKKIQAMYRDRIDRYWASYVNKGNLQVLVGRQAERELRRFNKAQVVGAHTAGTLKPPIKQFYATKKLSGVSILNDGVPIREPGRAIKLAKHAKPPPSHPHSIKIRKRWGISHDFKTLDNTSQTVVKAARKLSSLADSLNAQRKIEAQQSLWGFSGEEDNYLIEEEGEEHDAAAVQANEGGQRPVSAFAQKTDGRRELRRSGRGKRDVLDRVVGQLNESLDGILDDGALTGTDAYRGSRPASREGPLNETAISMQRPRSGGGGGGGGRARARSPVRRPDGSWDYGDDDVLPSRKFGDASAHHWVDEEAPDSPPPMDGGEREEDAMGPPVASLLVVRQSSLSRVPHLTPPEFGTEAERFHMAPGQAQIMPTYLRLQYREQAAARQELRLKEFEDHEGAAQVRKAGVGGSLLDLSRMRHRDYAMGRSKMLPAIGAPADYFHETDVVHETSVKDVDDVAEGKRLDRLHRFGSLGIAASDLVLNLRRRKMLESGASRVPLVVPRSRQALAAAHSAAASASTISGTGEWSGAGPAVERALGSFDFHPASLKLTRKGGRLPYPVPVDQRSDNVLDRFGAVQGVNGGRGAVGKGRVW